MKTYLRSACLTAALVAAGCASAPEPSDTQIIRAETTIENAENTAAPEFAPAELEDAREKLTAAKLSAQEGEDERALRLAKEAELDATVAVAMAEEAEAENALREVQAGIETLRQELTEAARQGGTQ